jgi:hypothetical protein
MFKEPEEQKVVTKPVRIEKKPNFFEKFFKIFK